MLSLRGNKMSEDNEIIIEFKKILDDESVPKNIRAKISDIIYTLNGNENTKEFKTNKVLQELDEISEEANVPEHTRTHIWSIVSLLESTK